ncbi:hypothetical protein RFI_09361 [Reticulomyxa filosa]|uniref:Uncharacterized protein n=1 Tax=Reticulomyxa filosa TaxID=46433 RepID=X6NP21_RETFI|nr:hypothetical protein RFI_09361 [Reticulomyxa filosa]|eukprot:ETO27771.1 hypothetical protein RFI_09361 [Reticulomyxa filosa]
MGMGMGMGMEMGMGYYPGFETGMVDHGPDLDESEHEVFELDNGEEVVVSKRELDIGDIGDMEEEEEEEEEEMACFENELHAQLLKEYRRERQEQDEEKHKNEPQPQQWSNNGHDHIDGSHTSINKVQKKSYSEIAGPKQGHRNIAMPTTTTTTTVPTTNRNITKVTRIKVCPFFVSGACKYGQACMLWHCFDENTDTCPHCQRVIGHSIAAQQWHMLQPQQCKELDCIHKERRESMDAVCGICHENIARKYESQGHKDNAGRFGILTGCNHTFCLNCLREWRGSISQSKEAIRGCPICREISYFIIPSDRLISDPTRKQQLIQKYKQSLAQIPCKHFQNRGECPFGTSCFYKHLNKDGTQEEVHLRHVITETGDTKIMKPIFLSDFLCKHFFVNEVKISFLLTFLKIPALSLFLCLFENSKLFTLQNFLHQKKTFFFSPLLSCYPLRKAKHKTKMTSFRSLDMSYIQVMLPAAVAEEFVDFVGREACIQFIDLDEDLQPFHKPHTKDLVRIQEIERRIKDIENQLREYKIPFDSHIDPSELISHQRRLSVDTIQVPWRKKKKKK